MDDVLNDGLTHKQWRMKANSFRALSEELHDNKAALKLEINLISRIADPRIKYQLLKQLIDQVGINAIDPLLMDEIRQLLSAADEQIEQQGLNTPFGSYGDPKFHYHVNSIELPENELIIISLLDAICEGISDGIRDELKREFITTGSSFHMSIKDDKSDYIKEVKNLETLVEFNASPITSKDIDELNNFVQARDKRSADIMSKAGCFDGVCWKIAKEVRGEDEKNGASYQMSEGNHLMK